MFNLHVGLLLDLFSSTQNFFRVGCLSPKWVRHTKVSMLLFGLINVNNINYFVILLWSNDWAYLWNTKRNITLDIESEKLFSIAHLLKFKMAHFFRPHTRECLKWLLGVDVDSWEPAAETGMWVVPTDNHFWSASLTEHVQHFSLEKKNKLFETLNEALASTLSSTFGMEITLELSTDVTVEWTTAMLLLISRFCFGFQNL